MIIFDTDMGVDDGLALACLLNIPVNREILISTIYGNTNVDQATANAEYFTKIIKKNIPIYKGASKPLLKDRIDALNIHGDDGMGGTIGIHKPATKFTFKDIVNHIQLMPKASVDIIGIGPATNIAKILSSDAADSINTITLMSGAVFDKGNVTENAEFNAYSDPEALIQVLSSGKTITIVPLDVCRKIQLNERNLSLMKSFGNLSKTLIDSHKFYMKQYLQWEHLHGCFPHDSISVLAALYPNIFYSLKMSISVGITGDERGQFFAQQDKSSNISVITGGHLSWVRKFFDFEWVVLNKNQKKKFFT